MTDRSLGKKPSPGVPEVVPHLALLVNRADAPPPIHSWPGVSNWKRLGSNSVIEACLHAMQQRAVYLEKEVDATDADAEALVEAFHVDKDGCSLADAMEAWKAGISAGDTVDKPPIVAALDPKSLPWLRMAIYSFGHCIVGLQCPQAWLDDVEVLDVESDRVAMAETGVALLLTGYTNERYDEFDAVWGDKVLKLRARAIEALADEAIVVMDREFFDRQGYDDSAFKWDEAAEPPKSAEATDAPPAPAPEPAPAQEPAPTASATVAAPPSPAAGQTKAAEPQAPGQMVPPPAATAPAATKAPAPAPQQTPQGTAAQRTAPTATPAPARPPSR